MTVSLPQNNIKGWKDQDYLALLNPEAFSRHFLNRELYPFQKTIIRNILKNQKVLVLCARQLGKTETISVYTTWYLFAYPNKKVLIFAPKYEQAVDNLFARILDFIKKSPKLMELVYREPTTGKLKIGVDNLKLMNDSGARAMSASKDANIEGWTGDTILIDESQSVADSTFYKKIMPMSTATAGKIIQIGTPRSRNHFYSCYNAQKTWKVLEYDWKFGTAKYKKEVMKLKKIMPHDDFASEYELKWIDAEALYFDSQKLDDTFTDTYTVPYVTLADRYIGIDLGQKMDSTVVFVVCKEGDVFRAVDIIKLGGSFDKQKSHMLQIFDRYKPRKILIDGTGLGSPFLDFLQADSPWAYKTEGYIMSQKNKASELFPNLKLLINNNSLELPFNDDLENEMRDLRKTQTRNGDSFKIHHPAGGHDDYVDALALACLAAKPFETKIGPPKILQFTDTPNGVKSKMFDIRVSKGKSTRKVFIIDENGDETECP